MRNNIPYPALLVTDSVNCRYFHRLQFAAGAILATADRTVYLCWSGRGEPELPDGVEFRAIARGELGAAVKALLRETGIPRIALESTIPLDLFQSLENAGVETFLTEGVVDALREIKSDWELQQLQRACDLTDAAFTAVLPLIRPGATELEIAAELEKQMRLGGSEESNRTIVAAGPNSAYPHHWPTDYVLQAGDFVTMDYGCTVNGYHSDMTRTVVVGSISHRQRRIYDTVLEAQLAGVAALRAGVPGGSIDRIARDIIDGTEFAGSFLHGLGHGIGLDIHEGTGLAKDEPRILKPGMVVSVEPGIYLEGYGGVRIEDIALVTEDGCQVLEHSPKELILV